MEKERKAVPAVIRILTIVFLLCGAMLFAACGKPAGDTDTVTAADAEPVAEPADYSGQVRISELMSKNRSAALSPSGDFCDWLEIENISGETLSLDGWTAGTEKNTGVGLDGITLEPGEYTVVFTADRGNINPFSFGNGDTLCLRAPDGSVQDRVTCIEGDEANTSYALNEDGTFAATRLATPGYENSDSGYYAYMDSRVSAGPLIISEVTVSNSSAAPQKNGEYRDWIELKNISSGAVDLSDYYLSDSRNDYFSYRLPDTVLQPGEYYLVWCGNDIDDEYHTGFGLNTYNENLYLCDGTRIIDFIFLHDIPVDGSCGHMDGYNGLFYFTETTPLEANSDGFRLVSEQPGVSVPAGAYDDVESLTVELTGGGTIYYTLDGSGPTTRSDIYNGPITFGRNTIIRAFRVEEGCAPSRVANYTYLINENITLPFLSMVVDDYSSFNSAYYDNEKSYEAAANLSLYNLDGTGFSANCGVSLAGWTSLDNDKKSFNVDFRSKYGDSKLTGFDIFGNGITEFDALNIRSGQDCAFAVIRDELCQELALELPDSHILTQASMYCILYINGDYRGIYALKENICEQFYASHYDFDADTVLAYRPAVSDEVGYGDEVLSIIYNKDLSDPENYKLLCGVIDIDNYIDWIIMEGWSANTDTLNNLRYYKSTEDGVWRVAYYDLDWAFWYSHSDFINLYWGIGNSGYQMQTMVNRLLNAPEFRERFLNRFAEAMSTTLSNENVVAKMSELYKIIEPEIERDRERWYLSLDYYRSCCAGLKNFIIENEWDRRCIETVCDIYDISGDSFYSEYMSRFS